MAVFVKKKAFDTFIDAVTLLGVVLGVIGIVILLFKIITQ